MRLQGLQPDGSPTGWITYIAGRLAEHHVLVDSNQCLSNVTLPYCLQSSTLGVALDLDVNGNAKVNVYLVWICLVRS